MEKQLAKLEGMIEAWIKAHDATALQFRNDVRKDIAEIKSSITNMPCTKHTTDITLNSNHRLKTEKTVGAFALLAISTLIGIFVALCGYIGKIIFDLMAK